MPSKSILPYLKVLHGIFNFSIMLLFLYQGKLGLKIRRSRKKINKHEFEIVRKHRKMGRYLLFLLITGFLSGKYLVYLDTGSYIEYPYHFLAGSAITSLVVSTFFVAGEIHGEDESFRNIHYIIGIMIIIIFVIQFVLGAGILL